MRNQLITEHILVNDHRIAAGAHGEGEPVIFPHGTPSSSLIWRNVAPCLVEAGMRVHLFDLLGYGLSERPHPVEVDTSMSAQTEGSHPGLYADHPRRLRAFCTG
ncbi:alpha/beta fold hydrolase [Affinirhizobium pseudoryzae]|uniref:alpha/beta fold hydrolase n=1 Tax=Allorhizobium pseudoryzae TaxID=379684 RepID=UPI0013EDF592|nr:alpha/beta fold hydrolase [Allorhizobium pseudoryzae]